MLLTFPVDTTKGSHVTLKETILPCEQTKRACFDRKRRKTIVVTEIITNFAAENKKGRYYGKDKRIQDDRLHCAFELYIEALWTDVALETAKVALLL
jgi:hypothetical protein